ncbi:MAG: Mov34/MPN/PAD-1 family protein [Dehalococcoidia bacterium]|nr:Mov34/MPN/PAD-1 family protein [Dehalococcoidia bacterium]
MTMFVEARRVHPNEAGGILVGVSISARPWITHAVPIPSASASTQHYEIPDDATPAAVDELRRTDPRLGYLGDWHSHPADLPASAEDVDSLRAITARVGARPRPVLAIIRRRAGQHRVDFLVSEQGRERLLKPIRTGALNPLPVTGALPSQPRRLWQELLQRFRTLEDWGRS